jgi:hypothetical protein
LPYICINVSFFILKARIIIRHFTAIFLLLVFLLGNSPRQWLHDIFASHSNCGGTFSGNKKLSVSAQKLQCKVDDVVIESPFVPFCVGIINPVPQNACIIFSLHLQGANQYKSEQLFLRGPPAFLLS